MSRRDGGAVFGRTARESAGDQLGPEERPVENLRTGDEIASGIVGRLGSSGWAVAACKQQAGACILR